MDDKKDMCYKADIKSGTSIGANINEAQSAESKSDFIHKLSISAKEARETVYWLKLLGDTKFIDKNSFESIHKIVRKYSEFINSIILNRKKIIKQ